MQSTKKLTKIGRLNLNLIITLRKIKKKHRNLFLFCPWFIFFDLDNWTSENHVWTVINCHSGSSMKNLIEDIFFELFFFFHYLLWHFHKTFIGKIIDSNEQSILRWFWATFVQIWLKRAINNKLIFMRLKDMVVA